jgi:hypothetical protein
VCWLGYSVRRYLIESALTVYHLYREQFDCVAALTVASFLANLTVMYGQPKWHPGFIIHTLH